jgi:hypothetical protein
MDEESLAQYYEQKLHHRINLILTKTGKSSAELIKHASDLGVRIPVAIRDPLEIVSELRNDGRWPGSVMPTHVTYIHGDLHFGNLIFGTRSRDDEPRIHLVDGKNQNFPGVPPGVGDPAYDFAKLLQSVEARTDRFLLHQEYDHALISDLLLTRDDSEDRIFDSLARVIDEQLVLYSRTLSDISLRRRARILMALHVITMSPAIPYLSTDIVAVLYSQGLTLLEDAVVDPDSRELR